MYIRVYWWWWQTIKYKIATDKILVQSATAYIDVNIKPID